MSVNYKHERLICPKCGAAEVIQNMTRLEHAREETYRCRVCEHWEWCEDTAEPAVYEAFRNRWNDPIEVWTREQWDEALARSRADHERQDRAWGWPEESGAEYTSSEKRAARRAGLAERRKSFFWWETEVMRDGEELVVEYDPLPTNPRLFAAILAEPDADEPRREYARWLRAQPHVLGKPTASFIDSQLDDGELLAADPRHIVRPLSLHELPTEQLSTVYGRDQEPRLPIYWLTVGFEILDERFASTAELESARLVDWSTVNRGFVEHVAIRASRFFEIADELYSLAPIRHLTLTYCKGRDHTDHELWKRLLDSPYLDQIRTLRLWGRVEGDNQYTELNRFTDEDIELLAESKHLRKLTFLEFRDQNRLTIGAFDALARSPNLPMLSHVGHEIWSHTQPVQSTWGPLGEIQRTLVRQPLRDWTSDLEARHGRIPWLHSVEHYGTDRPDFERVVAHPVR